MVLLFVLSPLYQPPQAALIITRFIPSESWYSCHVARGTIRLSTPTATPFSGKCNSSTSWLNVLADVSTALLLTFTIITHLYLGHATAEVNAPLLNNNGSQTKMVKEY